MSLKYSGCEGEYECDVGYPWNGVNQNEKGTRINTPTPEECQAACKASATCSLWTWGLGGNGCLLKKTRSAFTRKSSPGKVSGLKNACPGQGM